MVERQASNGGHGAEMRGDARRRYPDPAFRSTKARKYFAQRGLPSERPEGLRERDWWILERYVIDGWTMDEVATAGRALWPGLTRERVRALLEKARLWFVAHPEA